MGRRKILIVSHYTRDTGYANEVTNLIDSLRSLGLSYSITSIDSLGSWRLNSNYCSEIIRRALQSNPDMDVLRVDADAVFHKKPELLFQEDFEADIAAHVHTWPNRRHMRYELLGGTMFFRNNEKTRQLVDLWKELCLNIRSGERNGDILMELLEKNKNIKFYNLPPTYCKIFDLMRDVQDPIIEHFQASRRLKRQVNRKGANPDVHTRLEAVARESKS